MSRFLDRARALRADASIHYNCAQSVVIPFAETFGMTEEQAFRMAANFGGGMKMGATCGALVGALMALGLAGVNDVPVLQRLYQTLRECHDGALDCRDLLRINAERGGQKKPHCDAMVYELVALTEQILTEHGKL